MVDFDWYDAFMDALEGDDPVRAADIVAPEQVAVLRQVVHDLSALQRFITVDAPKLGKDHAPALQGQMIRDEVEPLLQSAAATAIKASAVTQLWCAAIRALAGHSPVPPQVTSLEELKSYTDQLVHELGSGPALEYALEQLMPAIEDALQGSESVLAAMRSSSPEHLIATSLALEPRLANCLRVVFACLRLPEAY